MRRFHRVLALLVFSGVLSYLVVSLFSPSARTSFPSAVPDASATGPSAERSESKAASSSESLLSKWWKGGSKDDAGMGAVIMGKMGNETQRAELGRSTWHLVHTMCNRYPKAPTKSEQQVMHTFIYTLSQVYPCGECAEHFQEMLRQHPLQPHLTSRDALAQFMCKLHNKVNLRLEHPVFDCNLVGDRYKCGCAQDGSEDGADGNKTVAADVAKPANGSLISPAKGEETSAQKSTMRDKPTAGDDAKDEDDEGDDDDDEKKFRPETRHIEVKLSMQRRSLFPEDYKALVDKLLEQEQTKARRRQL
ncbi:hypothetical protein RI367_000210 [Sorochytrium milnesiophthora]